MSRFAPGFYIGALDAQHFHACGADRSAAPPEGMAFLPVRALVLRGDETPTDAKLASIGK